MRCAVGKCKQSNSKKTTVSFYSFPQDAAKSKLWVLFCKRINPVDVQKEKICALHFKQEDFERNLKFEMGFCNRRTRKLKPGAIPTIETSAIANEIEISNEITNPIEIPNELETLTCDEKNTPMMTDIKEDLDVQYSLTGTILKGINTSIQEDELQSELQTESIENELEGLQYDGLIIKEKKAKATQLKKSKKSQRKFWCQERLLKRVSNKYITNLPLTELKLQNPNCGLSNEIFKKLLELFGPLTSKQDTVMRESIPVTTRLLIALKYLTTGCSFVELSHTYDVSVSAISSMLPVTLDVIYKVLSKDHLKGCKTVEEWKVVAQAFYNKWQFPMCLGAIDGKHIAIKRFSKHISSYRNYMGSHSIILLAVVDANYKFLMVDVSNGGINGATALNSSDIGEAIKCNLLSFPQDEELPGTDIKAPYVFVSNDTFNLSPRILQPYNGICSKEDKIYNYRLSKALQVVNKAFDILSNRFKILHREIQLSPEKAASITLACCALHNFLINEGISEEIIGEKSYLNDLENCPVNIDKNDFSTIRKAFTDFFNKRKVFFIET